MPIPKSGHAPGHIRDAFLDAIEALEEWECGQPEPVAELESNYVAHMTPISRICGLLWNCTDCLPGDAFDALDNWLDGTGIELKRRTYAAAARGMHEAVREIIVPSRATG